ncbi:response regulator transcription factor [Devosia sp.]|uniref:response regulator transcription factor n=1 Tax=Devosia sp. TaxID=1871048 RepID=UPI002F0CCE05
MRILLIEDDRTLGEAVRDHVAAGGHAVDWVDRLDLAADALTGVPYDLILLDLMLPDGRGVEFLRRRRRAGDVTPVVILTALDQISDRIEGLNAGADDYLVKPFDLSELSARLAAVARRYAGNPNPIVSVGTLEVDQALRLVTVAGRKIELTAREWAILERLIRRPGAVVSRAQLEDTLYEFGSEIESNAVEVHVSRLRKKLGRDAILTARGLGYSMGT